MSINDWLGDGIVSAVRFFAAGGRASKPTVEVSSSFGAGDPDLPAATMQCDDVCGFEGEASTEEALVIAFSPGWTAGSYAG